MKIITFFILFTITIFSSAWSQITEETIQDALEATKWTMNCAEETCLFQRDIYHNSEGETAMITVFVSIDNTTKNINRMTIFYPGKASPETGGIFAFVTRNSDRDELQTEKQESATLRFPFEVCIEDGCIANIVPNQDETVQNTIKEKLLNSSHIWFLYQSNSEPIRALAALSSFQDQYNQRYSE